MKLTTAVSVFCCLLQRAVAQVDISGCCTHVRIETTGEASIHQGNRIGEYRLTGVLAERPIYKNTEREEFLFYLQSKNKGLWMVGPTAGQFNGGLAHRGDTYCVEDVPANQWKYTDGSAWHVDPLLRVSCLDQSVTPQCLYNDQTEFVGGDLPEVFGGGGVETSMESSADCIEECEKRSGCKYWTWVMGEKVNCFLKNSKVDSVRKPKHVSGSIPKACVSTPPTPTQSPSTEDFILPHVTKKDEESTYNENEVNGKFKITSLRWDEKLSNPNSQEYLDLSNTIEDSLESMLRSERDLDEQAEFSVKVQKFRQGSVVCDFKVNYILKEAYIAIPFAIKPSNITDAMSKNFKFKKGILFQRFLIAAGSFNSSAPVDHCAAKGCSHKCDYDYDVEDYLCTCPRSLVLDQNEKKCISPEEAATEKTVDDTTDETEAEEDVTTILPEVKLTLLPTACLWSPWSDWTACSSSCGAGKKERQRSVVLPEKNGGACSGRSNEFVQCSVECEEEVEKGAMDNIEETVTKVVTDTEIGGSESDNENEQTTVHLKAEVILTNENDGSDENTEETTLPYKNDSTDVDEMEGIKPNSNFGETTMPSNTDIKTVTDIVTENSQIDEIEDLNDQQTTVSVNEDDFGRRLPAETTETEETQEITENPLDRIVPEITTKVDIDLTNVSMDESLDEIKDGAKDKHIVFPFTEDAEVVTSTDVSQTISTTPHTAEEDIIVDGDDSETSTLAVATDELKEKAEVPELSVDIEQDEDETAEGEGTTLSPTITTEIKASETSFDSDHTTKEVEGSSEIEVPEDNLEAESTTNKAEMRTALPKTDETDSATMTDMDYDRGFTYETTTSIAEMGVKISENDATTILGSTIEPEVSTQSREELSEDSTPDDRSTQIDDEDKIDEGKTDEDKDDENKDDDEDKDDEDMDDEDKGDEDKGGEDMDEEDKNGEDKDDENKDDDKDFEDKDDQVTDDEEHTDGEDREKEDKNGEDKYDEDNNEKDVDGENKDDKDKDEEDKDEEDENDENKDDEDKNVDNIQAEVTTTAMETTGKDVEADEATEENTTTRHLTENVGQAVTDAEDLIDDDVEGVTEDLAQSVTDDVVVKGVTDDVALVMETTTSTSGGDDTENAPIFDTENEEETEEIPKEEEEFTTVNPVKSEAGVKPTAVTVISIEETTEEVMIVTTVKPATVTDDDDKESTNVEEINTTENYGIEEQEFEDIDTSTQSSEYGDHEFLCKEAAVGDEESDVPMECVLTNGEEERTVVIVIPRDSLGGGRDKLFDKNVKIVVKDFMLMERSPRTLS